MFSSDGLILIYFFVSHSQLKILTIPPRPLTHLSYFPPTFPQQYNEQAFCKPNLERNGLCSLKVLQCGT